MESPWLPLFAAAAAEESTAAHIHSHTMSFLKSNSQWHTSIRIQTNIRPFIALCAMHYSMLDDKYNRKS